MLHTFIVTDLLLIALLARHRDHAAGAVRDRRGPTGTACRASRPARLLWPAPEPPDPALSRPGPPLTRLATAGGAPTARPVRRCERRTPRPDPAPCSGPRSRWPTAAPRPRRRSARPIPSSTTKLNGGRSSSTHSEARGSRARLRPLTVAAPVLNRTVPSSSTAYQTGARCGRPSARTVASLPVCGGTDMRKSTTSRSDMWCATQLTPAAVPLPLACVS